MQTKAKRTLVKSAPELWVLADDPARLGSWMAGLLGDPQPVPVEVIAREPERRLSWRRAGAAAGSRITIELADSGFGTVVEIAAQHPRPDGDAAEAVLEGLLDELGSPERRPFAAA